MNRWITLIKLPRCVHRELISETTKLFDEVYFAHKGARDTFDVFDENTSLKLQGQKDAYRAILGILMSSSGRPLNTLSAEEAPLTAKQFSEDLSSRIAEESIGCMSDEVSSMISHAKAQVGESEYWNGRIEALEGFNSMLTNKEALYLNANQ